MDEERYEITALIGKGRTGGVYEADDTQLDRKVAVRRFFCVKGDTSLEGWEEEFQTTALSLCHLYDPHILQVLDAGVDEDGGFLVSQLIDGTRLSDCLAERPLTQDEAYDLASQLLDSLSIAHEANFVHGAITAGSIHMVQRNSGSYRFVLMDLGLARLAPLIQGKESSLALMADLALLAPELFDGSAANASTDCYMVGHLIYMSLIGGHPFALHDREAVEEAHKNGELPPLTKYRSDLSPQFIKWISTLTDSDPAKRVKDTREAISTLPKKSELTASFASSKSTPPTPPPKVAPPPALARPPKPPTARQPVTPAPSLAPLSGDKGKSKALIIITVIIGILIIAAGSWYILGKKAASSSEASTQTPPDDSSSEDIFEFTELYKIHNELEHTTGDCLVSNQNQIDWAVYRAPSSTAVHGNDKSDHIGKIRPIGSIKEMQRTVGNLTFQDDKGSKLLPNLFGNASAIGDGWEIPIDISEIENDHIYLSLHFSAIKSDVRVEILTTDGDVLLTSEFEGTEPFTSYGIISYMELQQLQHQYKILVKVTCIRLESDQNKGISLNAVILE